MAFGAGLGAVLGLALAVFLVGVDLDYSSRTSAYDSAPVCASVADIGGCRYQGTAQITRTWMSDGFPRAQVSFAALGDRTFLAYLGKPDVPHWQLWETGMTVDAEVWHGDVSVIDGIKTATNPDTLPNAGLGPGLFFGIPTLVLAAGAVWSVVLYRRRAAALSAFGRAAASSEELPLTAPMSAYLDEQATKRGGTGSARKDLAAGVFMRSKGTFPVLLYQNRYSSNRVGLMVGGQLLAPTVARPLESITLISGTVDYLPGSRTLIEVRDEAGKVLWNRFSSGENP